MIERERERGREKEREREGGGGGVMVVVGGWGVGGGGAGGGEDITVHVVKYATGMLPSSQWRTSSLTRSLRDRETETDREGGWVRNIEGVVYLKREGETERDRERGREGV